MKRARDEFRFVDLEAREDDTDEGEDEGDEENEDDVRTSARI